MIRGNTALPTLLRLCGTTAPSSAPLALSALLPRPDHASTSRCLRPSRAFALDSMCFSFAVFREVVMYSTIMLLSTPPTAHLEASGHQSLTPMSERYPICSLLSPLEKESKPWKSVFWPGIARTAGRYSCIWDSARIRYVCTSANRRRPSSTDRVTTGGPYRGPLQGGALQANYRGDPSQDTGLHIRGI